VTAVADKLPFEGVIVLELGERVGAGACGSLLAMAGATVIVAEPPDRGSTRGKWANGAMCCAGKRSIAIRPGNGEDDVLLHHAIAAADVVILSSDMIGSLPSDVDAGPGTFVCDVTALAQPEPGAHLLCDKLLQALTGVASVTGTTRSMPTLSDAATLDLGSGIYAAAAVAAALRVRRTYGGGQRIRTSIYGCGVNALTTFLPFHFDGKMPSRAGNRHPMCVPWNTYRASDGWVLICCATDEQWTRLCGLVGKPDLAAAGGDLANLVERLKNCDAVDAIVQEWVGARTVDEAVEALGTVDIAAGAVLAVEDLACNLNVAHRRMVRAVHDPQSGAMVDIPGPPLAQGRPATQIPARDADRCFVQALPEKNRHAQANTSHVRPLAGVKVLEIGQYTTAPLAAKQMAALGAEVIKIEPVQGETSRAWPPHLDGESYFFMLNNANKRSLSADLRLPAHQAAFSDLVRSADVLVENLKPGSLARLGFPYKTLRRLNPRLVYCAISGYGEDSVYPGRPAFDTVIQAMCGLMDLTRTDGVPTKLGISIADTSGGMMGLFCILAMLELRDQTGEGCFIDLAMQDVGVWMTQTAWRPEARTLHTVLPCADGDVAVIGNPADVSARLGAVNVQPSAAARNAVVTAFVELGIPAAAVRTIDEVGIAERRDGGFIRMVDAGKFRWPLLELPFRLSRMPDYELKPIDGLGMMNAEYFRTAR
jgi:crotonobetainyl-CoA:carnitine CoA-transferase CaiB-like acyl-CoA transferase